MKRAIRVLPFFLFLLAISVPAKSQEWRENLKNLIYSPRYFGPTAFPIPEVRESRVAKRFEVEVRGQYHSYTGDKTKDFYMRAMIPVVKEKVAIGVSALIVEDYTLTEETRKERFAAETRSPVSYNGDVIFNVYVQLWKSPKWVDAVLSLNLKTASGSRLADARFTDAATYWFDVTFGKKLYEDEKLHASISVQALGGFYCWMTNDIIHRQNDAVHYGVGFTAKLRNFSLETDFSGFHGYVDNGDRPMILRNNLTYEYRKNGLSFRYHHGMNDYLYDTFALGYIRYF